MVKVPYVRERWLVAGCVEIAVDQHWTFHVQSTLDCQSSHRPRTVVVWYPCLLGYCDESAQSSRQSPLVHPAPQQLLLHSGSKPDYREVQMAVMARLLGAQANLASYPQRDWNWAAACVLQAINQFIMRFVSKWLINAVVCMIPALWVQLSVSKVSEWSHIMLQYKQLMPVSWCCWHY